MIDLSQLRLLIVRPTLQGLVAGGVGYSLAAENLLLGTGQHESQGYTYLAQVGGGPALGFWQMEPATFEDCWTNFIRFRSPLLAAVLALVPPRPCVAADLVGNLPLACAMARIRYARAPDPLPDATDVQGLAAYWKAHYNTPLGAGTVAQVLPAFQSAIAA